MLSELFPPYHPRHGEPTCFEDHLLEEKVHTIRVNADLWEARAEKINSGKAVLSIRQWQGKPYGKGTKKIEVCRLTHIGTQRITLRREQGGNYMQFLPYEAVISDFVGEKHVDLDTVAYNDGLSVADFKSWFSCRKPVDFSGVVIHFTDFRY